MIELPDHPWFVACQFHPEFTSTPRDGHPLFSGFIEAARRRERAVDGQSAPAQRQPRLGHECSCAVSRSVSDRPLFLIAGPCVIESETLALETAGRLKEITAALGMPFIYKSSFDKANRTSHQQLPRPGPGARACRSSTR